MRILFYLGHPAHYYTSNALARSLKKGRNQVLMVARAKDVLCDLVTASQYDFQIIAKKERGRSKLSLISAVLARELRMFRIALQFKPDILIGTDIVITHIGRLLKIPAIILNEDDESIVPLLAAYGFRYSNCVISPRSCRFDRYQSKKVEYDGFHKMTYLAPNYFVPNKTLIENDIDLGRPFFLFRISRLSAHHDVGIGGISDGLIEKLISKLSPHGKIYISSERQLKPKLAKYKLNIRAEKIHQVLYYSTLLIGDSQSMTVEAAILGTPSIRFSDFAGRIGVLEELEHKYGLTYGIKTSEPEKLYAKIEELLRTPNLKEEWQKRRQKMLSEKIDVTAFMVWFIENYPESAKVMRENPDYQFRFMNNRLPKHRSEAIVTS